MSNREKRIDSPFVHMYLALARPSQGEAANCIRHVVKDYADNELKILIAKLLAIGGYWRIHKTVNARDVEKARRWLIKDLIDHPEHGSYVDSQWRTALLQPECIYGDKLFMLDIDTKEHYQLSNIEKAIRDQNGVYSRKVETPKGWHYILNPFDTREVCKLPNVTLIRDGYYFVCEVRDANNIGG